MTDGGHDDYEYGGGAARSDYDRAIAERKRYPRIVAAAPVDPERDRCVHGGLTCAECTICYVCTCPVCDCAACAPLRRTASPSH